jgi:uncharacterized protein (TIGR02266 family)
VSECVTNISLGGMFISSDSLAPPGSRFRFELAVGNDLELVTGEAEVAWVREPETGSTHSPGMGVRFVQLDDVSRAIIFRIVDAYIQQTGRDPFSLE